MKKLFIIIFFILNLYSSEYYSKTYPIREYSIKSAVTGRVVFCDEDKEGKYGDDSLVIKIDDLVDRADLNSSLVELKNLQDMLKIAKKQYEIDKINYEKIKNLSTYARSQKDAKLLKMLQSKTNLLNIKSNLSKLKTKIITLKDKIDKKNIKISKKYYISKIYPKKGDFVNFGTPLVDIDDLSHARLIIFVTDDDLKKIKSSNLLINNTKQKYKIVKILKVADKINLSGYKVEIEIKAPKIFSKLVKVEIK